MFNGETIKLYHGTSKQDALRILKEGASNLYLTSSEEIAEYYAEERMEEVGDDDYVILEVEVSTADLRADFNSYAEPLSYFRKEWSDSERDWHEGCASGDIPYPSDERDWNISLRVVKCVRCDAAIEASHIRTFEY